MSTRPEEIVYSASWRDFIFANFAGSSFSTATGVSAQNPLAVNECYRDVSTAESICILVAVEDYLILIRETIA